jgi:hypothetical protein
MGDKFRFLDAKCAIFVGESLEMNLRAGAGTVKMVLAKHLMVKGLGFA